MAGDGPPWRSARLAETVAAIEAELHRAWAALLSAFDVAAGTSEESVLARFVADSPDEHEWRVVDAALDRLTCPDCGCARTKGPPTCRACGYHHDLRFAAREVDRPGVPPGNEHAIRVAAAVTRTRMRYSPRARVGYELLLADLVAGALPTTAQAQAAKSLINELTPEECDRVTSLAEVEELVRARRTAG